ncbi:MAG: permease-like cell division protein FtsX [Bacteroidota bacterium]
MAPESKMVRKTQRTSMVSTVLSISLVLFMLGLLGLLLFHANRIADYVKENIELNVMIRPDADSTEVKTLQGRISGNPIVKSSTYTSQEQAAEQLKTELGEDFVGFLGYNPLNASIDVRIKAEFADTLTINQFINALKGTHGVSEINYQPSLVQEINRNLRTLTFIMLGFSALLFIVSVALINNTIRLSLYARRLLIKSMLLVGATKGFIRKPFLMRSFINGFLGGIISLILLIVVVYVVTNRLPELAVVQDYTVMGIIGAGLVLIGILLSLFCTLFAVNKYLRLRSEELF